MGGGEDSSSGTHLFESFEAHQPLTLGDFLHRSVLLPSKISAASFHEITTESGHGVVDTAARGGLIGKSSLERLEVALNRVGLKAAHTNKVW